MSVEMVSTAPPLEMRPVDSIIDQTTVDCLYQELDTEGLVVLPNLLSATQLAGMQKAFESRLSTLRWNNFEGYQQTELHRHMVEDVLLLDQGFVDVGLHPLVKAILNRYLGSSYELNEAKGWKSIPTRQDFHGWHGDAWYEQRPGSAEIPREVKLAFYLSDVRSGAFNYIKRSHRKQHPRPVRNAEIPSGEIAQLTGKAGTAFLFDTSGIHRQGVPMLEARQAIFYNYHDPFVPLQQEDIDYYRYHPFLLNAAFLGNLSSEDMRILGFGNKTNFIPAFQRSHRPTTLYSIFGAAFGIRTRLENFGVRVSTRLKRVFGKEKS